MQVPEANKHIQVSAFDLNQARKGGKCIYLIEYDLIHDIERRDKTPWEVFKRLIQCGTILETVFDLESAGTLDDEPSNQLMLEVLYATVLEPDLLEGLVDVPPERVRLIEKNGIDQAAGGAAPRLRPSHRQRSGRAPSLAPGRGGSAKAAAATPAAGQARPPSA